jgi:ABC-type amino acid transport substrate-binding protein
MRNMIRCGKKNASLIAQGEPMRRRQFVVRSIACVVAFVALILAGCASDWKPGTPKPSVYDRVIQSGVIRASYANYPPYCIKDPNTGKMSGLYVDTLEEAARRLGLKVEWTEEVGWGAIFEGLNSDRHDIFGAGIWRNASRSKVGDFSRPLIYNVIKVWGRADEKRFRDWSKINSHEVRISTLDGAIEDVIAKSDFPNAARTSVPQLSPWTDVLLNITSKKADVTFAEPAAVNLFLDKNPGALIDLAPDKPLRVFANAYAFKLGEEKFKAMLNGALDEIIYDGTLDKIIAKYERHPGEFYRVAKPYELPAGTASK